ncbi:MAG: hypothetical protein K0S90_3540, partial [Enterobacteriaceae bacterium]|nr:hypothetical protein [Enterobacteriaceae bacterium]
VQILIFLILETLSHDIVYDLMLMTLVSDTNDLQLSYSMRDIQRLENAL